MPPVFGTWSNSTRRGAGDGAASGRGRSGTGASVGLSRRGRRAPPVASAQREECAQRSADRVRADGEEVAVMLVALARTLEVEQRVDLGVGHRRPRRLGA